MARNEGVTQITSHYNSVKLFLDTMRELVLRLFKMSGGKKRVLFDYLKMFINMYKSTWY